MLPQFLPKQNNKTISRFGLIVIIAIIATASLLRFIQWIFPASNPTLLSEAETVIQLSQLDDIQKYVEWSGLVPSQTFNAELSVIGVYPNASASFPKNTVALVYVKNNYRFVEVSYQPNKTLDEARFSFATLPIQKISLSDFVTGLLVDIRKKSYCKKPLESEIGVCQITKELLFEKGNTLIVISADGKHASDGELIEMARSIID